MADSANKVINPFVDIVPPLPFMQPSLMGSPIGEIQNFAGLQVGSRGGKSFRMDERGMWLGSNDFVGAPFSVDMQGNMTMRSSDGTGAYILIDATNNRIVVHDGTNPRVVIGKLL